MTFWTLIWNRTLRPFVLAIGLLMHLGIGAALGMWTFGLAMPIAYLAFVPPRRIERLLGLSNNDAASCGWADAVNDGPDADWSGQVTTRVFFVDPNGAGRAKATELFDRRGYDVTPLRDWESAVEVRRGRAAHVVVVNAAAMTHDEKAAIIADIADDLRTGFVLVDVTDAETSAYRASLPNPSTLRDVRRAVEAVLIGKPTTPAVAETVNESKDSR